MVYTSRPSRIGRTQVVWPENKRQYTVTPIHLCPLPSSPPVILCIPSLSRPGSPHPGLEVERGKERENRSRLPKTVMCILSVYIGEKEEEKEETVIR